MPSDSVSTMSVVEWVAGARRLVEAFDYAEIQRLESLLACTQDEAVSHFIEHSCCTDDLPAFVGGKGTPKERLNALRDLLRAYEEGDV